LPQNSGKFTRRHDPKRFICLEFFNFQRLKHGRVPVQGSFDKKGKNMSFFVKQKIAASSLIFCLTNPALKTKLKTSILLKTTILYFAKVLPNM
jgi:hypothetical protein